VHNAFGIRARQGQDKIARYLHDRSIVGGGKVTQMTWIHA
jgi:hypothetical protein